MKKTIYLFILLLICRICNAQNSFVNEYIYPNKSSAGFSIIENLNSSFTVASYFSNPGPGTPRDIGFFNCSPQGIITWSKSYTDSGNNQMYSFVSMQHHGYVVTGRRTTAPSIPFILFLDTSGIIMNVSHPTNYYSMIAVYSANDSSVYLFGTHDSLPQINITKLDVSGNLLWSKVYSGVPVGGGTISVTPDNGLLFSYIQSGTVFQDGHVHMCMVKTDSSGTPLWSKVWAPADTSLGLGTNSMELMNQNQYLFCMLLWSGSSNSWLVSFDSSGQVRNNTRFNDAISQGSYRLVKIKNNEIEFIKKHGTHFLDFIKLDTSLTVLNSQLYNDSSTYTDIADMKVTLADELIIIGNEFAGAFYHTLIIKTDTSSLTGCFETSFPTTTSSLIINDSVWTVTDSIVSFSSTIDTSFFSASSIVPSAVNVLCSITGINTYQTYDNKLRLSPNPVQDKLNIIVKNSELFEVILYDIASRKVLQHKFINSISLNTEQLAKGLYLYEVRNKNGVIKKGKIMKD